jgi:hypothetical protein
MRRSFPGRCKIRLIAVSLTSVLLGAACTSPRLEPPNPRAAVQTLDEDGVRMLFPSAPGPRFRLGAGNPNTSAHFVIEKGTLATPGGEGNLRFWRLPSHELTYASGGSGWTSRLHLRAHENLEQRYTWKTQHGYLLDHDDLRNQEFTVFIRVHGLKDVNRAQVSLKIRGGAHSSSAPERASCVMLTFSPASHGSITRFGKELTHPQYDYKTLTSFFPAALEENVWVGLKLVSWNDPRDARQVINRLYLDTEPIDTAAGTPRNHWRLFSEYVDIEGVSTGRYTKLVDWGGWQATLRTDGFDSIDFAWPSVRAISPP